MSSISVTAFEEFDGLARLFGRTRQVLDEVLARGAVSRPASSMLASETLPHIEGVESGFRARLRASDAGLEEIRALIGRGGLRLPEPNDDPEARAALIEAMQALTGVGGPRGLVAAEGRELAALEHARIAMALLPRLAAEAVHYPGRPTYVDIPSPQSPAEFADRIEEVERTIWHAATSRSAGTAVPVWRRVYAFFDAGEHLSSDGLTTA